MGKKSRKKPPAPLPLPCDRCAKRVPANAVRRCPKCELVVYCSKECQRAAWSGGHREQCQPMKRADILEKAGYESLMHAAARGNMAADLWVQSHLVAACLQVVGRAPAMGLKARVVSESGEIGE